MKIYLFKLLFCTFFASLISSSYAQFMSKKEASGIDNLLQELSEKHKPTTYLFKNVNVLAITDGIVETKNVLIENGLIKEIGNPINHNSAITINAKGKYLTPGLTDMHIHLFDFHQMKQTWMLLLLLHGVTTVRDMAGEPNKLTLRAQIQKNELLAPNLYQAGPIINGMGNQPTFVMASTPEQGREHVKQQKQAGYDFIKVYDDLSKETYLAIVDEAQEQDIPVVGHIPKSITLNEALDKQITIEHLTGYKGWRGNGETYLMAEDGFGDLSVNSNSWNCPTIFGQLMNWDKQMAESILSDESILTLLPKKLSSKWNGILSSKNRLKEALLDKYGATNNTLIKKIVQELYASKAKLIAGTDSGNLPLLIPGYSLHSELQELNALGISKHDVLKMATINAAMAMDRETESGSIEIGKRADLLLLNENPLENLTTLQHPSGVMVRGIWLGTKELEKIKLTIKTIFGNQ